MGDQTFTLTNLVDNEWKGPNANPDIQTACLQVVARNARRHLFGQLLAARVSVFGRVPEDVGDAELRGLAELALRAERIFEETRKPPGKG